MSTARPSLARAACAFLSGGPPHMTGAVKSPASTPGKVQPWQGVLILAVPAQFVSSVGFSIANPFMPLFIGELGTFTPREIAFWAGVVTSLANLASVIAGPVWGILSDWFGHKRNVLRASFGAGVVMALT